MIISVNKLKEYITTDVKDAVLEDKLKALELLIRKHTNNNFQNRNIRYRVNIADNSIVCPVTYFDNEDTIQISESDVNSGKYTIKAAQTNISTLEIKERLYDEDSVLITKIVYPYDIILGAVNMLKWDLENRDKVGIQSETISRHSVTYFNMDGDNSMIGYPKSLCGFMKPYMKARF